MTKQADPLKNLRVASPCHVGWEQMSGTDRVRLCDSCNLHVYNFADMTTTDIKSLLLEMNGQVCGRLHRRADGTIITRDCPVGLRALHQRVTRFAGAVFATVLSMCSVVFSQTRWEGQKSFQQMSELQIKRDTSNRERSGKFMGLVVDVNGASIVGAEVSLKSPFGNKKRVVYTDDTGVFTFTDVKDGNYLLNVSALGFRTFRADYFELKADEYATTQIKLFVAPPQMPVDEATLGFVISEPGLELNNTPVLQPSMIRKRPNIN